MAENDELAVGTGPSAQNPDDDHDSDMEELQQDLDRFDQSLREVYNEHTPAPRHEGSRRDRGHLLPIEPRGDIKARLYKVNNVFMLGDYNTAIKMTFEIIRINAETVQAWNTLGSIFREQGEHTKALMAMVYAAHLQPRDTAGWLQCADFALRVATGEEEDGRLSTARLCYSAALKADPKCHAARLGKATVCHRQGHLAAAITDYSVVLQNQARVELDVVRKLAEACVGSASAASTVSTAIAAYQRYVSEATGLYSDSGFIPNRSRRDHNHSNRLHHQSNDLDSLARLTWQDAGIYADLYATIDKFPEAISGLKFMARLIVGRVDEDIWNSQNQDDREWDAGEDRRLDVVGFDSLRFDKRLYGDSLPLELRARLAAYRLVLHHIEEALVCSSLVTSRSVACVRFLPFKSTYIWANESRHSVCCLLPLISATWHGYIQVRRKPKPWPLNIRFWSTVSRIVLLHVRTLYWPANTTAFYVIFTVTMIPCCCSKSENAMQPKVTP